MSDVKFTIRDIELTLLAEKAIWIASVSTLIISDAHLGKIEHFRKEGIPIPAVATEHTAQTMLLLLRKYKPERLIFLGDLFHSAKNASYENLENILSCFDNMQCHLILGNHDIMHAKDYDMLGIDISDEMRIGELLLTHEPLNVIRENDYNLAGHIHPGVRMVGKGKQVLTLPCYYFGLHHGILPAFGYFTGKSLIKIDKNASIFAIGDHKVFPLHIQ